MNFVHFHCILPPFLSCVYQKITLYSSFLHMLHASLNNISHIFKVISTNNLRPYVTLFNCVSHIFLMHVFLVLRLSSSPILNSHYSLLLTHSFADLFPSYFRSPHDLRYFFCITNSAISIP